MSESESVSLEIEKSWEYSKSYSDEYDYQNNNKEEEEKENEEINEEGNENEDNNNNNKQQLNDDNKEEEEGEEEEEEEYEDDGEYEEREYNGLEQAVINYSLTESTVGGVDDSNVFYSQREINVMKDLFEFIMTDAVELLPKIFTEKDHAEPLATAILSLTYSKHLAIKFVREMLREEFSTHQDQHSLFRENSSATRVCKSFLSTVGQKYLIDLLGKFVNEIINDNKLDLEIDDFKIKSKDVLKKNTNNLTNKCSFIVKRILETYDSIPPGVKLLARMFNEFCEEYFPQLNEDGRTLMTGSFIVLRYINSAIFSPEKYGLCKDEKQISVKARRNLVLISKVLQNLSNGILFSGAKEPFMQPMNEFLEKYMAMFKEHFKKIVEAAKKFPYTLVIDGGNDSATNKHFSLLHHTLCLKGKELIDSLEPEESIQFCQYMIALGDHTYKLHFLIDFPQEEQQKLIRNFLSEKKVEGIYVAKVDYEKMDKKKKKHDGSKVQGIVTITLHHIILTDTSAKSIIKSIHCLSIKRVESIADTISIEYTDEKGQDDKLIVSSTRADEIIISMLRAFKSSFSGNGYGFSMLFQPEERLKKFQHIYSLRSFSQCGGFVGVYEACCMYLGQPINQSVEWFVQNTLTNDEESSEMNISRFYNGDVHCKDDLLRDVDLIPIFLTLKDNSYFTKLVVEKINLVKCYDSMVEFIKNTKVLTNLKLKEVDMGKNWYGFLDAYCNGNQTHPIKKLNLSNCNIEEKAIVLIGTMVRLYGVESLVIPGVCTTEKLSSALMEDWKKLLEEKTPLKKLDISKAKLSSAMVDFLSDFIGRNFPYIEQIKFENMSIPKNKSLLFLLKFTKHLKSFNISGLKVSMKSVDEQARDLIEFLPTTNIKELVMDNTSLPDDVWRNIISAIPSNNVSLSMAAAEISFEMLKKFAPVFAGLPSVVKLNLSDCPFGDDGLIFLLDYLCQNTVLESLDISRSFNGSKKEGVVKGLIKLILGANIKELYMEGGQKSSQQLGLAIIPLFDALSNNNCSIQKLDVGSNGFGNKGAFALANMISVSDNLIYVNWDVNQVGVYGLRSLSEALKINKSIHEIKLPIVDCGLLNKSSEVNVVGNLVTDMINSLNRNNMEEK